MASISLALNLPYPCFYCTSLLQFSWSGFLLGLYEDIYLRGEVFFMLSDAPHCFYQGGEESELSAIAWAGFKVTHVFPDVLFSDPVWLWK